MPETKLTETASETKPETKPETEPAVWYGASGKRYERFEAKQGSEDYAAYEAFMGSYTF